MKRSFIILMASLLMLPACTKEIRTETLKLEEEIPFHEGSANALSLNLDIDFPVAGFSETGLDNVRRTIRTETLGEAYADFGGSLQEMGQAWRNTLAEDYRVTNQSMLQELEMKEDEAPFLNWGSDRKGAFGETYGHYVNYIIDQYDYQGGAHGMYGTFPIVFDRKTGEVVPQEHFTGHLAPHLLKSLIDEYKYDNLKDIISEAEIEEENIFYVESIEPSPYFTVGEDGITYYYQPYDIAPYVFGVITITIPWAEL